MQAGISGALLRIGKQPVVGDFVVLLDQPELAVSLGAVGTLRKPVTREALLGALERWGV